jgi:hypothetical protein
VAADRDCPSAREHRILLGQPSSVPDSSARRTAISVTAVAT